ncbi:class I SAM-dependent methyltransferase [Aquipuribacter sp. MA13-6]|uniref:class I SAM-dependent methyltransferase n=1 Tax=unclassified Aquipuribacter TaxID=2635084 RepID=UPI003EEA15F8
MTETTAPHVHGRQDGRTAAADDTDATYWEARYAEEDRVWSGRPNELLVREVADLPSGTALEIGCGEGADSIWLAQRGWRVTAVDIAATALRRAAEHADDAGVGERITWAQVDLTDGDLPSGEFDLVCAQYYHSPAATAGSRETVLRQAVSRVGAGGHLLVVGHAAFPTWLAEADRPDVHLPSTAQVRSALRLPDGWTVQTDELVPREAVSPDGEVGTRADNVLLVRRGL